MILFLVLFTIISLFVVISLIYKYKKSIFDKLLGENKSNKFYKFISSIQAFLRKLWAKPSTKSIASSLIAILFGLIIGSIVLLCLSGYNINGTVIKGKSALLAIKYLFFGVFSEGRVSSNVGDMFNNAMPLILTGLSVAVAFKTGLFNIGAPGQYLMSTAITLFVALSIDSSVVSPVIIWILAFAGGILAGALWALLPGLFKAFLNVNEVITCIMTNWISAIFVTGLFDKTIGPLRYLLNTSPTKNYAYVYVTAHNNVATSKLGLDKIFAGSQINGGIIIAILIGILMYIIIYKTTFGFELRACGSNKNAAKYVGINEKRSIVYSMAIAGALSGAGAALYWLSGNTEFYWATSQSLPATAFNGIPVALLATNNPIGVIFSATFMAYLDVAGLQIKYNTPYNEYITSLIGAIIVYFSAFALWFYQLLSGKVKLFKHTRRRKKVDNVIIDNKEDVK